MVKEGSGGGVGGEASKFNLDKLRVLLMSFKPTLPPLYQRQRWSRVLHWAEKRKGGINNIHRKRSHVAYVKHAVKDEEKYSY